MVLVKISREDIESGVQWKCRQCPLAIALKRAYDASEVLINYNNFNLGTAEKPNWAYRGHAILRWKDAQKHPTWDFSERKDQDVSIIIRLPNTMTKWAADYDRIGNARQVSFRVKWHPQQR
jgi:hypothetical protein